MGGAVPSKIRYNPGWEGKRDPPIALGGARRGGGPGAGAGGWPRGPGIFEADAAGILKPLAAASRNMHFQPLNEIYALAHYFLLAGRQPEQIVKQTELADVEGLCINISGPASPWPGG